MMNDASLTAIAATAVFIGAVHTLLGPDHYVPFIVMSRVREWSTARTLAWTLVCGVAHVGSSVVLGLIGIALGLAVSSLTGVEALRGSVAAWLMFGFGVAYGVWGLHRALKRRPHTHWHHHDDGTAHTHDHGHEHEHAHVHEPRAGQASITPWVLFTVFVLGPCEPLIPILMYPAARHSAWGVALVTLVFGIATLTVMTVMVLLGRRGLALLPLGTLERYTHALAGAALAVCGLSMQVL